MFPPSLSSREGIWKSQMRAALDKMIIKNHIRDSLPSKALEALVL